MDLLATGAATQSLGLVVFALCCGIVRRACEACMYYAQGQEVFASESVDRLGSLVAELKTLIEPK